MADNIPEGSVPSPKEFLPDQMQMESRSVIPPELTREISTVLLPSVSPLLNRMADLAKQYGIDMTFMAQNGMKFAFRSSDYSPGDKAQMADLIHGIVANMESYTIEDFKKAVLSLHDFVHKP